MVEERVIACWMMWCVFLVWQEMVLAISSLSRGSLTDKLRWIFHLYDADADGFISRQELKDVIVAAHRLGGNGRYILFRFTCAD